MEGAPPLFRRLTQTLSLWQRKRIGTVLGLCITLSGGVHKLSRKVMCWKERCSRLSSSEGRHQRAWAKAETTAFAPHLDMGQHNISTSIVNFNDIVVKSLFEIFSLIFRILTWESTILTYISILKTQNNPQKAGWWCPWIWWLRKMQLGVLFAFVCADHMCLLMLQGDPGRL